jgi:hypothetical protein
MVASLTRRPGDAALNDSEDDIAKWPSALARVVSVLVAPGLQSIGFDPLVAGMASATVSETATVGIDAALYRLQATGSALETELKRRPTLIEVVRAAIPTRKGRAATRAFLNAAQTATSDERLADLAGILVGGLSEEAVGDELTAHLLKLAGDLSHFEAVHLWDHALGNWQPDHDKRWSLHARHGSILQSGEHAGKSPLQFELRAIALERMASVGLLTMTSARDPKTNQGPFYGLTRLAVELFCMIDAAELPKELIRKHSRRAY